MHSAYSALGRLAELRDLAERTRRPSANLQSLVFDRCDSDDTYKQFEQSLLISQLFSHNSDAGSRALGIEHV